MSYQYKIAKVSKNIIEENHKKAVAVLREVSGTERGPMGLTPDHIKQTPEWKVAYQAERAAFKAMQHFNREFSRQFKAEIRAERAARRG